MLSLSLSSRTSCISVSEANKLLETSLLNMTVPAVAGCHDCRHLLLNDAVPYRSHARRVSVSDWRTIYWIWISCGWDLIVSIRKGCSLRWVTIGNCNNLITYLTNLLSIVRACWSWMSLYNTKMCKGRQNECDTEVARDIAVLLIILIPCFLHGMDYIRLLWIAFGHNTEKQHEWKDLSKRLDWTLEVTSCSCIYMYVMFTCIC